MRSAVPRSGSRFSSPTATETPPAVRSWAGAGRRLGPPDPPQVTSRACPPAPRRPLHPSRPWPRLPSCPPAPVPGLCPLAATTRCSPGINVGRTCSYGRTCSHILFRSRQHVSGHWQRRSLLRVARTTRKVTAQTARRGGTAAGPWGLGEGTASRFFPFACCCVLGVGSVLRLVAVTVSAPDSISRHHVRKRKEDG